MNRNSLRLLSKIIVLIGCFLALVIGRGLVGVGLGAGHKFSLAPRFDSSRLWVWTQPSSEQEWVELMFSQRTKPEEDYHWLGGRFQTPVTVGEESNEELCGAQSYFSSFE